MVRLWIAVLSLVFCVWLPRASAEQPYLSLNALLKPHSLVNNAWFFIDDNNSFDAQSLSTTPSLPWQPLNQTQVNLGYTQKSIWLRLRLDSTNSNSKKWNLAFENALLDQVLVYKTTASGPRIMYNSGAAKPYRERAVEHRYFVVPLNVYQPSEYLIRISSSLNLQTNLQLWPEDDFWRHYQFEDNFNWLFYGIIFSIMLYNLFLFMVVRDFSYLYFVGYVGFYGLYMMMLDGYAFAHLWPEHLAWNHRALHISVIFSYLCSCGFVIYFLNLKERVRSAYYLILGLGFSMAFLLPFSQFLPVAVVSKTIMVTTLVGLFISLIAGVRAYQQGFLPAVYFVLAWFFYLIGNVILIATKSGWLTADFITLNFGKIGTATEAMLLSFALGYRIRMLRQSSLQESLKAQAQSQFLAHISHEIRTPMNGLIGMVDLLSQSPLNPSQKEYVKVIQDSGQTLLDLISDVLDLSRLEVGRMPVENTGFNINNLCDQLKGMFHVAVNEKSLSFDVILPANLEPHRIGDIKRIKQILINLIGNAIKFTEKGSITLKVTQEVGDLVRFDVIDTGIGISTSAQDKIFQAYLQENSGITHKYGGSGLGLKICNELVSLLGGDLGLKSSPGTGSTFWFVLPLSVQENPTLDNIQRQSNLALPLSLNVLVAEDNLVNQKVIKGLLGKLGYEADLVCNGQKAVDYVRDHASYDLVLMDREMPLMDGFEATRQIRQVEVIKGQPAAVIFALTAHAISDIKQEAMQSGCDYFLTKPIGLETLKLAILEFLGVPEDDGG